MKRLSLLAAGMLMASAATYAQKGVEDGSQYGHGEDSLRCIQNLVMYGDAVKQKNFQDAYSPWLIVFDECPLAKKTTLYSDGVKIMKDLYNKTADATAKAEYYDLLMRVYDQRIKYYGNHKTYPESWIKGMKGIDIMTYKPGDNTAMQEALGLLKEAINGKAPINKPAFLQKYMEGTVKLYQAGVLGAEAVVDNYIEASNIVSELEKTATEKDAEKIADAKNNVEQIFAQSGAADCETISKIFGAQLNDNTENLDWLTRVNKLLSKGDCTEDELYYATSEYLHKIQPAASSARGLAKMYIKQNDVNKAIAYYEEAISLEEDNDQKARYYYELSTVHFSNSSLSAAKSAAYSAIKLRDNWGDPYILLGKIYAAGARNIGEKDYEKKAGYWAAVDKFQKAKAVDSSEKIQTEATDAIRQYSQYFPSKEELFFEGIQDGSSYTVGGFIGETTTVRSKK